MVTHDARADHGHGFDLGWIDLARHDRAAGLVGGKCNFREAATRPGIHQADIITHFHQRGGEQIQLAVQIEQGIVSGELGELVTCWLKVHAAQLIDLVDDQCCPLPAGIEPGANRCAADGEFPQTCEGQFDLLMTELQLRAKGTELLTKGNWRGVHQVRSATGNHVLECHFFLGQRSHHAGQGREQIFSR